MQQQSVVTRKFLQEKIPFLFGKMSRAALPAVFGEL
jgi:hypothetical protein